jgi:hypothetical protein
MSDERPPKRGAVRHRIDVEKDYDGTPRATGRTVEVWTGWQWIDIHALLDQWEDPSL